VLTEKNHAGNERKQEQEDVLLCLGRIKIACLDANTLKPCAIPASIRQEIFGDG